jgi:hypothetical protein
MGKRKNPHAVAMGRKGGRARKRAMTPEQLSDQGRKAVSERWRKYRAARAAGGVK